MGNVSKVTFSKDVSKEVIYRAYLTIINGLMKLAPKEIDIAAKLYYHTHEISKNVKDGKLQGVLLFSKDYKKLIANELGMDNLALNNYIANLKKKSIILVEDKTGVKWMHPRFVIDISKDSVEIIFNLNILKDEHVQETNED